MSETQPRYIVENDLTGSLWCLEFHGVSGEIDCQGHDVEGFRLLDVHDFSIRNCHTRQVYATNSVALTIANNTITAPESPVIGGGIWLAYGRQNQITGNTINGNWQGQPPASTGYYMTGADDGIVLESESELVISGNSIQNVWDCGIERLGPGTDRVTIRDNTITNARWCGIGSWYAPGWTNSLFSGNTVVNSWRFLDFHLDGTRYGLSSGVLENNIFENNRLRGVGLGAAPDSIAAIIDFVTAFGYSTRPAISVGNNVFRNNDFGDKLTPYLVPANGFIDGGGNICKNQGLGTVLKCQ